MIAKNVVVVGCPHDVCELRRTVERAEQAAERANAQLAKARDAFAAHDTDCRVPAWTKDKKTVARFWAKVIKGEGCWEWSSQVKRGYGSFVVSGGREIRVCLRSHRASWEIHHGSIAPEMHVHHVCRNKLCVRPDHLELLHIKEHSLVHHPPPDTHCRNGHPWVPANILTRRNGRQSCQKCINETTRLWRERQKGVVA